MAPLAEVLTRAARATMDLVARTREREPESFLARPELGPAIGVWAEALGGAGAASREELEEVVRRAYRDQEVASAWEDVLEAEEAWTSMLATFDTSEEEGGLMVGEQVPLSTPLLRARGGGATTLGEVLEEGVNTHLVLLRHFA